MSTKRGPQAPASTGLILTFLGLVSLVGLLLGILTHVLVNRTEGSARTQATVSTNTRPPATSTVTSSASTASSSTPTSGFTGRFDITVSVSPKSVTPGQQITVTVHAYTADTHAPISGLQCALRAPIDGSPSLLATYPAAQTTDDSGAASWIVTAPSQAAGTYEIEAYAQTHAWSFKADSAVTLTGA